MAWLSWSLSPLKALSGKYWLAWESLQEGGIQVSHSAWVLQPRCVLFSHLCIWLIVCFYENLVNHVFYWLFKNELSFSQSTSVSDVWEMDGGWVIILYKTVGSTNNLSHLYPGNENRWNRGWVAKFFLELSRSQQSWKVHVLTCTRKGISIIITIKIKQL